MQKEEAVNRNKAPEALECISRNLVCVGGSIDVRYHVSFQFFFSLISSLFRKLKKKIDFEKLFFF